MSSTVVQLLCLPLPMRQRLVLAPQLLLLALEEEQMSQRSIASFPGFFRSWSKLPRIGGGSYKTDKQPDLVTVRGCTRVSGYVIRKDIVPIRDITTNF